MAGKILIAEDDAATAAYLRKGLQEEGFVVDHADNGRDALFLASEGNYRAIVLDRMLPQLEGLAVLRALRAAGIDTPVLILSALGSSDERVAGLQGGADDYLVKPFGFAELLARLNNLMRRGVTSSQATTLTCEDLELDLLSRRARRGGDAIDLQPREFKLLEFLMRHQNQVVTRTMLLEGVWDFHFDPGTNVIDVHVGRLRRKLDEGRLPLLQTVRGAGYRLGAAS